MSAEPAASASQRRLYTVAHRSGNNLHHLERALAVGADAIECDLWHYHGKLALRHERKLPALPILYDRWYIRFSLGVLRLPDLLREVNFRAELFLDIKSSTPRAADSVLELYRDNEAMMPRTRVSSKQWHLLDRLGLANTRMEMFYSVGRRGLIEPLLRRAAEERPPTGTSIRQTLLTPRIVERLHNAGLQVYAWTVNNPRRGEELASWGVDGIIADNLDVLGLANERDQTVR